MAQQEKTYFYRKYPGLTMAVFMLLLVGGILKVADVVLFKRAEAKKRTAVKAEEPAWIFSPIKRVIRLREIRPNLHGFVQPGKEYLEGVENLENKKYQIFTDENGFVTHPSSKVDDSSNLVVFLGGSTTECLYVSDSKRFAYLTGQKLSALTGKKTVGLNSGVSGNHSMHANNLLINKVLPLRPKAVVLMENVNDLNLLTYEGSYWNKNVNRSLVLDSAMMEAYNSQFPKTEEEKPEGWLKGLFPYLSLRYAIFKSKLKAKTVAKEVDEWASIDKSKVSVTRANILSDYRSSLKTFVSVCKAWGITPVLMTQQNRILEQPDAKIAAGMKTLQERGIKYEDYRQQYIIFNQTIREVAKEEGVLLVDLDKLVPKTSEYIYDVVHVNDKGSELISDIVSKELSVIYN